MKAFVLLAARRSGTTFFLRSLQSHPKIHCQKEIFDLRNKFRYFQVDPPFSRFYKFRTASFQRRLDYLFRRQQLFDTFLSEVSVPPEGAELVGLRLAYNQARKHTSILKWARKNEVRVIHLVRENCLKTLVSIATAAKRRLHHSTAKVAPVTIHLNPRQLLRRLDRLSKEIQMHRATLPAKHSLEVTYESFVASQDTETRRVLDFLGIEEFAPLSSDLVKLNPDSLADIVENYDEIQEALQGTAFEKFLQQPAEKTNCV